LKIGCTILGIFLPQWARWVASMVSLTRSSIGLMLERVANTS